MGETVQKRMERFAPAILELKESSVFSEKELNKIVTKVKKNEHKMAGGTKCLDDYKSAIKYDQGVLTELKKRKKAKNALQKNAHLDWIFIKRIVNTYRRGLINFPTDYNFNIEFFEFLKYFPEQNRNITNDHVKKMIKTFGHEPDAFRKGAAWFFQCGDINETRNILLRGQALHPQNLEIYLDLIELEVQNHTSQGIEERLKKYIDAIVKNNVTHRFLEEAVKCFEKHDNLQSVVDYAINHLLVKYREEEEVWDYVALRELKGNYHPSGNEDKRSTSYSIKRTILRYKEGISKLPLERQPLLWKKYLDVLMDIVKDFRSPETVSYLREALERAEAVKIKRDVSHYLAWMDCCGNNEALLVKKLEEGTKEHSTSVMLWSLYLKHYLLQDEWKFGKNVFEKAIDALGSKAIKIWELYLDFHLLKSPASEVDVLYEKAINEPHQEIASFFKPRYLTWVIVTKSIEAARELYLKIADKPPYSKKLHEEMFLAEQMEYVPNGTTNLRNQVLELWTKQFGTDEDVYFQRIGVVREQGGPDTNEKIGQIYEEAIRNLSDDEKVAHFKKRFEREKY